MKRKIGLFGGTFDPIHCGHLRAAEQVMKRFLLDQILFIPSFIPPHKERRNVAPAGDRLKMVELACREYSGFEASSVEVEAQETSYSIITLKKFKTIYPGAWIFFILGADAFVEIGTWRDYERVIEECLFIVMSRSGYHFTEAEKVLEGKMKSRIHRLAGGEEIPERLLETYRIFFLSMAALDISSTDIRKRIKTGQSVKGKIPDSVEKYIRLHHLYQGA